MVKIVILTGSPHANGTSSKLADSFQKGAIESGNEVYRYDAGLQGPSEPHFLQMKEKLVLKIMTFMKMK